MNNNKPILSVPNKDEVLLMRKLFNHYVESGKPDCPSMLTLGNINDALVVLEKFYGLLNEPRCPWCLRALKNVDLTKDVTVYNHSLFHKDCFIDYQDHYKD